MQVKQIAVLGAGTMGYSITQMARKSPVALHMAKVALNNGAQADLHTALDIEARCFALCFGTQDRFEGMNAFHEKQKPEFKGF